MRILAISKDKGDWFQALVQNRNQRSLDLRFVERGQRKVALPVKVLSSGGLNQNQVLPRIAGFSMGLDSLPDLKKIIKGVEIGQNCGS